ncbi:hypothetical protein [Lysobacter gummosus]
MRCKRGKPADTRKAGSDSGLSCVFGSDYAYSCLDRTSPRR